MASKRQSDVLPLSNNALAEAIDKIMPNDYELLVVKPLSTETTDFMISPVAGRYLA